MASNDINTSSTNQTFPLRNSALTYFTPRFLGILSNSVNTNISCAQQTNSEESNEKATPNMEICGQTVSKFGLPDMLHRLGLGSINDFRQVVFEIFQDAAQATVFLTAVLAIVTMISNFTPGLAAFLVSASPVLPFVMPILLIMLFKLIMIIGKYETRKKTTRKSFNGDSYCIAATRLLN